MKPQKTFVSNTTRAQESSLDRARTSYAKAGVNER